jgi:hypothetical protein
MNYWSLLLPPLTLILTGFMWPPGTFLPGHFSALTLKLPAIEDYTLFFGKNFSYLLVICRP